MELKRRGFLAGLAGLLAAPAIIRPGLLMPVSLLPQQLVLATPQQVEEVVEQRLLDGQRYNVFNTPAELVLAKTTIEISNNANLLTEPDWHYKGRGQSGMLFERTYLAERGKEQLPQGVFLHHKETKWQDTSRSRGHGTRLFQGMQGPMGGPFADMEIKDSQIVRKTYNG